MDKTAWELKRGDVIQGDHFKEVVLSVRQMIFDGELDGLTYQKAPVVRLELAGMPRVVVMAPGDRLYKVIQRGQLA